MGKYFVFNTDQYETVYDETGKPYSFIDLVTAIIFTHGFQRGQDRVLGVGHTNYCVASRDNNGTLKLHYQTMQVLDKAGTGKGLIEG